MKQLGKYALALSLAAPIVCSINTSAKAISGKAIVNVSWASIYTDSTKKTKLAVVKQKTTFTSYSKGKTWTKVTYKGKTGYILTKQLMFKELTYQEFVAEGKALTKQMEQLAKLEQKGDVSNLAARYQTTKTQFASYEKALKASRLNTSQKNVLQKQYVKASKVKMERFAGFVQAWEDLVKTESYMKQYNMKSAKTTWKRAVKVKTEADAKLRKNKWTAYAYKANDAFERYMKTLERRFTYVTYDELQPQLMNRFARSLDEEDRDVRGRRQYNGVHQINHIEKMRVLMRIPVKSGIQKITFTVVPDKTWVDVDELIDNPDGGANIFVMGASGVQKYELYSKQDELKGEFTLDSTMATEDGYYELKVYGAMGMIVSNMKFWYK